MHYKCVFGSTLICYRTKDLHGSEAYPGALLLTCAFLLSLHSLRSLSRPTMAGVVYTPSWVQNLAAVQQVQQENAAAFEWAMRIGVGMVIVQVNTDAGMRLVAWTYNKVMQRWQPAPEEAQPPLALQDKLASDMSPLRRGQFDERFQEVQGEADDGDVAEFEASRRQMTPEKADWVRRNKNDVQQPQFAQMVAQQTAAASTQQQPGTSSTITTVGQPAQTVPASQQIRRVNAGQNLLPIDDDNQHRRKHSHLWLCKTGLPRTCLLCAEANSTGGFKKFKEKQMMATLQSLKHHDDK